ncbi:hypothetical protein TWF281_007184 [Arthrobotrys megalospora]
MMLKPRLLYYLLLGSSTLATVVPAQEEKAPLFSNPEIRASELNAYLHPNATYTEEYIDCADGEPILSQNGTTMGCFFQNSEEDFNRAVRAIAAEKNIPAFTGHQIAESSSTVPQKLQKREEWYFWRHYCYGSGVYGRITPDFDWNHYVVCASMDEFAGRRMRYASWSLLKYGEFLRGYNMYAVGSGVQIKHDYAFECLHANDDWVYTDFRGRCLPTMREIIDKRCLGGSGYDSRGGTMDIYMGAYTQRPYRLRVDPNPLSGNG